MTVSRRARSSLPLVAVLAFVATAPALAQGIESPRVPVRTAIQEINTLRSEYMDLYNKKNVKALTAIYLPDAVMIRADGSVLLGQEAIGKALAEDSPNWKHMTITSDTMRVFSNTAWDMGKLTSQSRIEGDDVSHYLVVLRRGVERWQISSVAVVPVTQVTTTK